MLTTSVGIHSVRVVIYENERYSPVSGWSSKALLPTERKAYSSGDGQDGFATLEEASSALISKGWSWEGDWLMDTGTTNADKDGWSYAAEFGSFGDSDKSGSATKGMLHFVRRRKLIRHQFFDVASLAEVGDFTCDHCDLQEVQALDALLLDKLVAASLRKHPRKISHSKVVALKSDLVRVIETYACPKEGRDDRSASVGSSSEDGGRQSTLRRLSSSFLSRRSTSTNTALTESEAPSAEEAAAHGWKTADTDSDPQVTYTFASLSRMLDQFVGSSQTAWSIASSVLVTGDAAVHQQERTAEIAHDFFQEEERRELARLVIRRYDHVHAFHCAQNNCGQGCIFAVEQCPHTPCQVCYSRKWALQHDAVCPEKLLPCERACSVMVPRKNMAHHLQELCGLRPVLCPFHCLGCAADLVARDLDGHQRSAIVEHMQLLLAGQLEHRAVLSKVYQSVQEVDTRQKEQLALLTGLQAAHAAATVALHAAEVRQDKSIQNQIQRLDSKLSGNINRVQTELNGEVGKLRKSLSEISGQRK